MNNSKKQGYIRALKKLENSTNDKVGILGKLGIVTTGATAGVLGASTVASAVGATTLFGSSTLASIAGGILVTSTPIGWVIGTAAAGTAAAYGISKLLESGATNDERKRVSISQIKKKIDDYARDSKKESSSNKINKVAGAYAILLENDLITQEKVTAILSGIEDGKLDADYALSLAQDMINEVQESSKKELQPEANDMIVRSSFVLLYKHMMNIDKKVDESELKMYYKIMFKTFKSSKKYAKKLLHESPSIENKKDVLKGIAKIIPAEKHNFLIDSLIAIAHSDGEFHPDEQAFVKKVKKALNSK